MTARRTVQADASKIAPMKWAWQDRVPLARLSLLVGEEGLGKGVLGAYLIARWTRGELPGGLLGEPVNVLIIGDEDGINDTWTPRLEAAGADLKRVRFDVIDATQGSIVLGADLDDLRDTILATQSQIVMFDQIVDNLPARADNNSTKDVRAALAPLRPLLAELQVAAIATLHPNKKSEGSFRQLLSGSAAWAAIARSGLMLIRDPDNDDAKLLLSGKVNNAKEPPALRWRIRTDTRKINGYVIESPVLCDLEATTLRRADLLNNAAPRDQRGDERVNAEEELRELLADHEWHPAAEITAAIKDVVEFCEKQHITRAKKTLDVESRKAGLTAGWEWRLPKPYATLTAEPAAIVKAEATRQIEKALPVVADPPADAVGVSEATARRDVSTASNDAVATPDGKVLGDGEHYSPAEQEGVERALREQAEPAPIFAPLRTCRCEPRAVPGMNADGKMACSKCGHPIAGEQS
jgi:hypothetical protein